MLLQNFEKLIVKKTGQFSTEIIDNPDTLNKARELLHLYYVKELGWDIPISNPSG